jgi:hypothetical protein
MGIRQFVLRALAVASIVASAATASAQAPSTQDLVGMWNLTLTSPQGTHPTTLTIKDEAGELVGTLTGLPTVGGVKVATSDAGVRITFAVDYEGQPVDVVMVGKLTGAEIKGTVDYASGAATGDFSGSKAGTAPAAAASTDAASLSGTWNVTSPSSSTGWTLELTQDGTAISGTLKNADQGISLPVKGMLENGTLSLTASGEMAGTLKATVEAGELKGGSYDIGGNSGSWSATRKP